MIGIVDSDPNTKIPLQGIVWYFSLRRDEATGQCLAFFDALSISNRSTTARRAKAAGDELAQAVWPRALAVSVGSGDPELARWQRDDSGWSKHLYFSYSVRPQIDGAIDLRVEKLGADWVFHGTFSTVDLTSP